MAKRGKKKTKKRKGESWWRFGESVDWSTMGRSMRIVGVLVLVATAGLAAAYGLTNLDAHVDQQLAQQSSLSVAFVDLPDELVEFARDDLYGSVSGLMSADWTDDALCREMAARVEAVSWVAQVEYARRRGDGRFEVSCRYRRPFAMTQDGREFFLVDREGVRLPGSYQYDSAWPLIQGASAPVPDAGQPWPGKDMKAGLTVIDLIARMPFAGQVTAVLVENVGGRVAPRRSHIELATDRAGGRIHWGSAPGMEVEENSVEQKLAILTANFRRTGRADADHAVIDVSTFPDRFTIPG